MKIISIITINYNDGDGLNNTIKSVIPLLGDDVEYVVVDGASTDSSLSVLSESKVYIDKFISEPDTGIANAFNKGIGLASGLYLMFINSGDVIADEALTYIKTMIKADDKETLVHIGKIQMKYEKRTVVAGLEISKHRQLLRNYLPHQAMVIKASCFDKFGLYEESYRLGMDYEWSLRLLSHWDKITFHNHIISIMDTGGVSMTNYADTFKAYHLARKKHKVMPASLSYLISLFFIVKRTVGLMLK